MVFVEGDRKPKVSVIIPSIKGEDLNLLRKSIYSSSCSNVEIIVVQEGLERSAQRNIGIKRALGEYLLFADSDWVLSRYLIEECVKLMDFVNAIYIPEIIKTKGLFAKIRNWERQFYTATPIDVVRFVRAKNCPLFDETMSGPEDSDWDRKIKGRRETCTNPYYHHDNVSIIAYFKKKAYYSKSMNTFESKHKGDKILDLKWRCLLVFLENRKWKHFISNPIFAIITLLTIAIRGIIYMRNK